MIIGVCVMKLGCMHSRRVKGCSLNLVLMGKAQNLLEGVCLKIGSLNYFSTCLSSRALNTKICPIVGSSILLFIYYSCAESCACR